MSLKFSEKNINYVSQLIIDSGSIKQWHEFKREQNLHESYYFQWLQLIHSISERWQFIIKENYDNATNLIIHNNYLIKYSRVIALDKLTSTEMYSILTLKVQNKSFSNIYFENLLLVVVLTRQQSICYHAILLLIPICNLFNTKS